MSPISLTMTLYHHTSMYRISSYRNRPSNSNRPSFRNRTKHTSLQIVTAPCLLTAHIQLLRLDCRPRAYTLYVRTRYSGRLWRCWNRPSQGWWSCHFSCSSYYRRYSQVTAACRRMRAMKKTRLPVWTRRMRESSNKTNFLLILTEIKTTCFCPTAMLCYAKSANVLKVLVSFCTTY